MPKISLGFLGLAGAFLVLGTTGCPAGGGSNTGKDGSATIDGGGGATGSGGTSLATGGSTATGGASASGGATATGGSSDTGGATSTGGATATGGTPATGGRGGATATGGRGGTTATGGRGTGGAATGGAATGGASAGGATGTGGSTQTGTKFVGNTTTNGEVRNGFVNYWNQIAPENEGKWGSVQPSQGSFNWSALDRIYAYANTNNIIFKQHTFIWGSQQPSWVNSGNAQTAVQAWMKAFCDRYPNTKMIDVVNEPPPHTTPAYIAGMGGAGTSGYDWIVNAFKWARAACPNAILMLNDYDTIEYAADNTRMIDIVTKIKAAGAPIDAIGAQAHAAYKFSSTVVQGFIAKLAGTGLPVYITEFDIPIADDAMQKAVMQDQFTMFWNDSNVKGITLWGYIVGSTWKVDSGLQQTSGTMRPAMSWLMTFLGR